MSGESEFQSAGAERLKALKRAGGTVKSMEEEDLREWEEVAMRRRSERYEGASL